MPKSRSKILEKTVLMKAFHYGMNKADKDNVSQSKKELLEAAEMLFLDWREKQSKKRNRKN